MAALLGGCGQGTNHCHGADGVDGAGQLATAAVDATVGIVLLAAEETAAGALASTDVTTAGEKETAAEAKPACGDTARPRCQRGTSRKRGPLAPPAYSVEPGHGFDNVEVGMSMLLHCSKAIYPKKKERGRAEVMHTWAASGWTIRVGYLGDFEVEYQLSATTEEREEEEALIPRCEYFRAANVNRHVERVPCHQHQARRTGPSVEPSGRR